MISIKGVNYIEFQLPLAGAIGIWELRSLGSRFLSNAVRSPVLWNPIWNPNQCWVLMGLGLDGVVSVSSQIASDLESWLSSFVKSNCPVDNGETIRVENTGVGYSFSKVKVPVNIGPVAQLLDMHGKHIRGIQPIAIAPKCECGAHKVGIGAYRAGHSTWCPLS